MYIYAHSDRVVYFLGGWSKDNRVRIVRLQRNASVATDLELNEKLQSTEGYPCPVEDGVCFSRQYPLENDVWS